MTRVGLTDVRSYDRAEVRLEPGVTLFLGANAQGKTNLVEAVLRAAIGSSHRVSGDQALVRRDHDLGVIRLEARTDNGRRRTLDVEIGSGRRTRTRVDGNDVTRAADAAGVVKVVMFAPEDVAVIRGDPGERRRFLDDLLGQRRPAYVSTRSDYDRVLRQRNQLLKQARGLSGSSAEAAVATLESWTRQLVHHGATLMAARLAAVHALSGIVRDTYHDVADRPEPVTMAYESSTGRTVQADPGAGVPDPAPLAEELRAALAEVADEERRRGITLVGPHRDDLVLAIDDLPARTHASQGEAWSLALALRVATHDVLAEVGDRPLVILDDVFAELDLTRRRRLADRCDHWDQVLVTAAVESDVPLRAAHVVEVTMRDRVSSLSPRGEVAEESA
nr:DNA replication/repair protein RecF [Salsipaludibacter albus]